MFLTAASFAVMAEGGALRECKEGVVVFVASWNRLRQRLLALFFLLWRSSTSAEHSDGAVRAVAAQLIMTWPGLRTLHVGTATLVPAFSHCLLLPLLTLSIFPSRHETS